MKKILSIALAVVMVLGVASVAMAFDWSAPTSSLSNFDYQIDVIKFTTTTQAYGSASFQEDNAATAVNGAPVYFAIKLTVPNLSATNEIRESAVATVKFTAIDGVKGVEDLDISNLSEGVYYYYDATQSFQKIEFFRANVRGMNYMAETPVYAMTCLDTDTAKVYAEVSSDRPLDRWFNVGNYDIGKETISANDGIGEATVGSLSSARIVTDGLTNRAHEFAVDVPTITPDGANWNGASWDAAYDVVVTFTIGDLNVSIDVPGDDNHSDANVQSWASGAVASAVAAAIGSSTTIDGVPYSVSVQGGAVHFKEIAIDNSNIGDQQQYRSVGNSVPAVDVELTADNVDSITVVEFREAATPIGSGDLVAVLPLNSNDKVLAVITSAKEARGYDDSTANDPIQAEYAGAAWAGSSAVINLYAWLDDGNANSFLNAVNAGEVYMTDSNMRTAFGFANSVSDSVTWAANSTPIILDPTVSIPKTGDNASVIGFAMIMAAVVLAAVAVKKVKA